VSDTYKTELDRIEKRDRRQLYWAGIFFFLIALLFISLSLFQYSGRITNVTGVVTGMTGGSGRSGKTYLVVKLENGIIVEALLPEYGSIQKDRKVILEEMRTIFGYKRYFFKEYAEEAE